MDGDRTPMPADFRADTLCFTVDVEWAHPEVLADVVGLFDAHGVRATFFVTHAGVDVPGHERGLHPNFRRNGETMRALAQSRDPASVTDEEAFEHVIGTTASFAPEAKGTRSHSLFHDSTLNPLYKRHGIEFDCSHQMPLVPGLRPYWRTRDILAVPTYYADHFDIVNGATSFRLDGLRLDRPGLKVFDFHPNMIYLNACDNAEYMATKAFYHDPGRLLAARHQGRGCRTLLTELLEKVARDGLPTASAGEINHAWRAVPPWT